MIRLQANNSGSLDPHTDGAQVARIELVKVHTAFVHAMQYDSAPEEKTYIMLMMRCIAAAISEAYRVNK